MIAPPHYVITRDFIPYHGGYKSCNQSIMSTEKKKRITKQVRVSKKAHELLASFARSEKMTISKVVDLLVKTHINKIL